ncbi:5'/3'-nucleotidase SurE [Butyrivibrio sp. AE2032]|uniref:5'/3'-nucleotidase SurE n=1 Tax=Butyrivibrio sp. AE2032 TaxID=1458463 RepID=UPI00054F8E0B|nr:5'/3'-nucleotidase SurE [Butyrivibrio sp. AE2032]
MRKILITNDDGINSEGLARLARAASEIGEVWVVAPDSERSAMSHSVTLRKPVEVWEVPFPVEGVKAYACDGKPSDCVRVGVLNIVPGRPDLVFSGINYGYNVAADLQYSATVGAAFEGSFQGVHSIAFSEGAIEIHEVTDKYLSQIMKELVDKPLSNYQIWNVNFPGCTLEECKGIAYNRKVSHDGFYKDRYKETKISDGRMSYMVDGIRNWEAAEGTDLRAILDHYVSVGIANNIS